MFLFNRVEFELSIVYAEVYCQEANGQRITLPIKVRAIRNNSVIRMEMLV